MLVCKIELWPYGKEEHKKLLAVIPIWNVGGNLEIGDYQWAVSHQEGSRFAVNAPSAQDPVALARNPVGLAWKHGRVEGFKRGLGAVQLLARVLREAFKR